MFLQPDWWEVMQPGVGTNRYSYSFGDPVNGIDPSGHNWKTRLATALFGGVESSSARKAGEKALKSGMNSLIRESKAAAWRQEVVLVRAGGGSRLWSETERLELLKTGKVANYHADHINNVASRPDLAGLANNIQFLSDVEHKARHMANGGYQNPISGDMIDRAQLLRDLNGGDLPASAIEQVIIKESYLDQSVFWIAF
jgi:hypothetical protein